MPSWDKETIPRENGELVQMQVPENFSASRSTDVPMSKAGLEKKIGNIIIKTLFK